ncbi:exopolysaccharide biosynthesis protein [Sphingomonas turrisvirgatae]|uniref:Exopolysaccharide biosynthesis protein n=2 Tax=Sphingomonas turrisvirgatae TaxID=1888892 RepID=A0A1E3LT47_9SPHN|nr:exopolysaccharide biosynthesis protein [Sphingomonas turrisvirgatae]
MLDEVAIEPAPEPQVEPAPERHAEPAHERHAEPASPPAAELVPDPVVAPAPAVRVTRTSGVVTIDREKLAEAGMIVPGGHVTALAEEFRLVKRQLLNTSRAIAPRDADKARMVLVCSAKPNDGKTFCAINLALSLAAEKDVEILLVDADFAKPDILNQLGAPEGPGLLDVLNGNIASAEDCILDTDVPQLRVLPAGTRTVADTELLASERAHAILDGLAAANPRRIVIFDSPPVLAASPASVLASHVGQVMLVVRADKSSESDLREAVALLDGCDEIQLVLNRVSFQPGGRRYGGYGAYYGEPAQ